MRLFSLIDHALDKVKKEQLEALKVRYEKKKNLWNTIRWIFVAGIVLLVFILIASQNKSNENAALIVIGAVICLIISWIGYFRASKANIKSELYEMSIMLYGGARQHFIDLFADPSDNNLEAVAKEWLANGLLEIFDKANTPENINAYLKTQKYSFQARKLLIKMFKELKQMVTLVVEEFNISLDDEKTAKLERTIEISSTQKKMEEIRKLYDAKLINEDEYIKKKEEILKEI